MPSATGHLCACKTAPSRSEASRQRLRRIPSSIKHPHSSPPSLWATKASAGGLEVVRVQTIATRSPVGRQTHSSLYIYRVSSDGQRLHIHICIISFNHQCGQAPDVPVAPETPRTVHTARQDGVRVSESHANATPPHPPLPPLRRHLHLWRRAATSPGPAQRRPRPWLCARACAAAASVAVPCCSCPRRRRAALHVTASSCTPPC